MTQDARLLPQSQPEQSRDLDPNVLQRRAADPNASVWVSASAGSGKTKVLTDRVLRLLLPRQDGAHGTAPHKILCLTFTKAGAGEMALRINKKLGDWAVVPHEKLQDDLSKLLGRTPNDHEMNAARRLFAAVVDVPGGLKIMTIHSFCQSILGRFPLESGLSPHFHVLEEAQAQELLQQAQSQVFKRAASEKGSALGRAFFTIAAEVNEQQCAQLIQDIIAERHQLARLFERNWNAEGLYASICESLIISPQDDEAEILLEACQENAFDGQGLQQACAILANGTEKTDQPKADIIQIWLEQNPQQRAQHFEHYKSAFFTTTGEPRKTLTTKKTEGAEEIMRTELDRLCALQEHLSRIRCAASTRDLFILGDAVRQQYQDLKAQKAAMDFDDLIIRTVDLLHARTSGQPMNRWVQYKLDEGLDHILIDEAQDTNPEQWEIIDALCEDFFSGEGAREDLNRTIFSVGDKKQSIYSFQRAAPEEFERRKDVFSAKAVEAKQTFEDVPLNISFRSVQTVLDAVDRVFEPSMQTKHYSFRRGQAGLAELWPLFESEAAKKENPWAPPTDILATQSASVKLAEHIAQTIRNWLDDGEFLPSRARRISAGDIMILLRTRNAFAAQLMRALRAQKIPVSGADRMILSEQLPVEDLLAVSEFCLLPSDDLTLACVLKSPLIGWSEEELFAVAVDRPGSLWDALPDGKVKDYLSLHMNYARSARPFEFYSRLLQTPCPADDISGLRAIQKRLGEDAMDPVDELLNATLEFEKDNVPSLQQFVHWQKQQAQKIKREMEDAGDKVRIMTVHGAKGLQAPIVILPDTTGVSRHTPGQAGQRLLWPEKSGLNIPLWSPRKETDCDLYRQGFETVQDRLEEEYQRLLYVAMTRAEDRLYIGGYTRGKSLNDRCWYSMASAIGEMTDTEQEGETLRLSMPQSLDPDRKSEESTMQHVSHDLPGWLFAKAPAEPHPPAPLIPSRATEEEEPQGQSPSFATDQSHRFRRGNVTHKLLEFLPDLAPERRKAAAESFLETHISDLSQEIRKSMHDEIFKILDHPDYAPFFANGSQAEVPISGLMPDGRLISGQIDRLLVTDDAVWVIDYKTNRTPPENSSDIPVAYHNQMKAYHDTLTQIYSDRPIHCALLWTDGPVLMPLELSSK